jgi:AcrR family transcriptional regulator
MENLTRERVCREALALVDEEGLDALTMRRLGTRLGVEAMSLYKHVRDKADLLDALHGAVLGHLADELPAPGRADAEIDWRELLAGLARALRKTLLAHPNVVPLVATRPVRAPEALQPVSEATMALVRAGFSARDAEKAIICVGVFTIGCVLGETQGAPDGHPDAPRQPGQPEFRFGLDALITGIAVNQGTGRKWKP